MSNGLLSSNNCALGFNSLYNGGGDHNVAIGYTAGTRSRPNNSYNTFLGSEADLNNDSNNWTNSTALGYNSKITASNQIVLGTSSETVRIPKFTTAGVVHNDATGNLSTSLIGSDDMALDISYNGVFKVKDITVSSVDTQVANKGYVDLKAPLANPTFTGTVKVSSLNTAGVVHTDASGNLSTSPILDADISNNAITSGKLVHNIELFGNPSTTTQSSSDNSTRIATTAYVKSQNYVTSSSLGVMPVLSTEPTSPVNGSFYFDNDSGFIRVYYGGSWKDFAQRLT